MKKELLISWEALLVLRSSYVFRRGLKYFSGTNYLYFLRPEITVQGLWQGYGSFRLVILQQTGHNTGQRERAAIEGVDQLRLAGRILKAGLHPIGLE